ncbi:hypothetical protein [Cumulibacter soli]|uniref:hypothetical protein n=1 Tax=Cumulibacter soli TaxID=2546344 RepID=UPI0010685623|nr:hypothetical protein [Cumulibacter soli]
MRLHLSNGIWTNATDSVAAALTMVIEVDGGLIEWTVDEPDSARVALLQFDSADWLWQAVGADDYARLLAHPPSPIEVEWDSSVIAPLRDLALGHWMRRWWPASARDAIERLDTAVLDAELVVRTAACERFFDTAEFDAELVTLLGSVIAQQRRLDEVAGGDDRVARLLAQCRELADEFGVSSTSEAYQHYQPEFALAAGNDRPRLPRGPIASGTSSLSWSAVPPDVFDAAEDTVAWSVHGDIDPEGNPLDVSIVARIAAALAHAPDRDLAEGVAVSFRSGDLIGAGALDRRGQTP